MIKIFKNDLFLFFCVTVILSLLEIVDVNANEVSVVSCDSDSQFYKCSDGKKHKIENKNYHLTNSVSAPISAIYVGKQGTVVDASQINVTGDNPNQISAYGVNVEDGGKLTLTDSNFKNVPGLRAYNAVIDMTKGSIEGSLQAIYAEGEKTDIALVSVNIGPGDSNIGGVSISSISGAFVRLSGSTVNFEGSGSFETEFRGRYLFDRVTVKGKGEKSTFIVDDESADEFSKVFSVDVLPETFRVAQGGHVHLRDSSIQLTDMHGFLIKTLSGFADINGKLVQDYDSLDEFKNTIVKIERSDISVQGEGTYGLYFDSLDPKILAEMLDSDDEKLSKAQTVISGRASVHLLDTTFTVPDGTAIYSTGPDGYGADSILELSKTSISGNLLLKAENNSSLLVRARASSLTGGTRVEDISIAGLELTHGSTWFLKEKKHKGLQESDSTDSFISFVSLSDSTIVFDQYISNSYQTLHIGKETDRVDVDEIFYNADGNVQIKLRAFLNSDGSFDAKKADRILIYGNVGGTTLVYIENFLRPSEQKVSDENVSSGGSRSVSLIQVAGTAQEDSFKLGRYTTINGLPYQYHLRGYGPGSSFGEADAEQRLVTGSGEFWDFRLESVYINPKPSSSEFGLTPSPSIKPTPISVKPISSVPSTSSPSASSVPSEPPSMDPKSAPSFSVSPELPTDSKSDLSVSPASVAFQPTPSAPAKSSPLPPKDSASTSSVLVEPSSLDPTASPLPELTSTDSIVELFVPSPPSSSVQSVPSASVASTSIPSAPTESSLVPEPTSTDSMPESPVSSLPSSSDPSESPTSVASISIPFASAESPPVSSKDSTSIPSVLVEHSSAHSTSEPPVSSPPFSPAPVASTSIPSALAESSPVSSKDSASASSISVEPSSSNFTPEPSTPSQPSSSVQSVPSASVASTSIPSASAESSPVPEPTSTDSMSESPVSSPPSSSDLSVSPALVAFTSISSVSAESSFVSPKDSVSDPSVVVESSSPDFTSTSPVPEPTSNDSMPDSSVSSPPSSSDLSVSSAPVASTSISSVSAESSFVSLKDSVSDPSVVVESSSPDSTSTSLVPEPTSTDSMPDSSVSSPPSSSDLSVSPAPVASTSISSVSAESSSVSPKDSVSDPSVVVESSSPDSTSTSPVPEPASPDSTIESSVPVKPFPSEPGIRVVVPQLPTYLLLPNVLFYTGLMDLTTQNKRLEIIRNISSSSFKGDEISVFFVRGYGGSYHYASNLSAFEYGYGAELDYTALEVGVLLKEIESSYRRILLGIMGTYGKFSLQPQDVEQSKESPFDKWSVSAYGNMQHDTDFYMNGVFSYGPFRGDVLTLARGKAATLKGRLLSTSLTSGKALVTRYYGVVFDPQIQLVYQRLQFDRVRDVDHLDVDMGEFNQWTGRVGGCLTKNIPASEERRLISFYSKLYLMYNFEDKELVYFKHAFQLGALGSSLEAGLGFKAQLSAKFGFYGNIVYQHRLTKAGFSEISFSSGLRYLF